MSDVQLHLGDCLEVMKDIPAGSVDAILTDIPYGTTACAWDEIISFEPMWAGIKHVLKPRGVFVTTASQPFTSRLVMSNLEWFKYEWVWDKRNTTGFMNAKYMPMKQHENLLVFCGNKTVYNPQFEIISKDDPRYRKHGRGFKQRNKDYDSVYGDTKIRWHAEDCRRYPKSIIRINTSNGAGKIHPTKKPVALYEYLTRTYTNEGDTVCDITMGSGTTGVACVQTGRNFIGIEIEPKYYEIAEKRIKEAQMQLRLGI